MIKPMHVRKQKKSGKKSQISHITSVVKMTVVLAKNKQVGC